MPRLLGFAVGRIGGIGRCFYFVGNVVSTRLRVQVCLYGIFGRVLSSAAVLGSSFGIFAWIGEKLSTGVLFAGWVQVYLKLEDLSIRRACGCGDWRRSWRMGRRR